MKRLLTWLLLTSLLMNCGQQEVGEPACNVNTDYTNDPAQAAQWLIGEWKLVEVSAMIPNPPVENLRLRFTNGGEVITIRDNQQTGTSRYAIDSTAYGLYLKSGAESSVDKCYLRNASLRVCAGELFFGLWHGDRFARLSVPANSVTM